MDMQQQQISILSPSHAELLSTTNQHLINVLKKDDQLIPKTSEIKYCCTWNNWLCGLRRDSIAIWNTKGKCVAENLNCKFDGGNCIVAGWGSDKLCCSNSREALFIATLEGPDNSTLKIHPTFPAHSGRMKRMLEWKGMLVTASWDNTVKVWRNWSPFQPIAVLQHDDWLLDLAVWGDHLCTAGLNKKILLFVMSAKDKVTLHQTIQCNISLSSLTVWKDWLCSGDYNRAISIYNKNDLLKPMAVFVGHTRIVWSLVGWKQWLFSGADDKTVRVWNEKGDCVQILDYFLSRVEHLFVWNHRLCVISQELVVHRIVCNDWTPQTHLEFPDSLQKKALSMVMLANRKWHPESPFCQLPREILYYILSFAIDPWE